MKLYFDTSVLLARWVRKDAFHSACRKLFDRLTKAKSWGVISWLSLVETASVVARQYTKFEGKIPGRYTKKQLISAYLQNIVAHPRIQVMPPSSRYSLSIGQQEIQTFLSTVKAIDIAPKLGLTSLDNLHLAIASLTPLSNGSLAYFVTGDKELLENASLIEEHVHFNILNPRQALQEFNTSQ